MTALAASRLVAAEVDVHFAADDTGSTVEAVLAEALAKEPGKPVEKVAPFTCPVNSTVAEFAGCVHRDFAEKCIIVRLFDMPDS